MRTANWRGAGAAVSGIGAIAIGIGIALGITKPGPAWAAAGALVVTTAALWRARRRAAAERKLIAELAEYAAYFHPPSSHTAVTDLRAAIRRLVEAADAANADAATRIRTLEIKLEVMQTECRRAQAIVDGMAGAVPAIGTTDSAAASDPVARAGHDLRTPLASIKAYVEMLIDGEAPDAKSQGEFFEIIQSEANRLGRLIDDLLASGPGKTSAAAPAVSKADSEVSAQAL